MYYLIFISIALALYALYVAKNAHRDKPRSFHFTLIIRDKNKYATIKFYVLYLSGTRVFLCQDASKNINLTPKINTWDACAEISNNKLITCESQGKDSLVLQYIADKSSKMATQSEELSLDLLSLPNPSITRESIEKHLKQAGWEIERALSGDDLSFDKENLSVYLTYIS